VAPMAAGHLACDTGVTASSALAQVRAAPALATCRDEGYRRRGP